jgi:hypothetical protein
LVVTTHPNALEDNFTGRLAYCVDLLGRYDIWEWFGNSDRLVGPAADSGIAYTITTQSIVGLTAFWLFFVLNAEQRTTEQIKYLHGVCVYIALTMLVSYSLFSIKTAALLWFIHGSFQMAVTASAGSLAIGRFDLIYLRSWPPRADRCQARAHAAKTWVCLRMPPVAGGSRLNM